MSTREFRRDLIKMGARYTLATIKAQVAREAGLDEPSDPFMQVAGMAGESFNFGGNNEPSLAMQNFPPSEGVRL